MGALAIRPGSSITPAFVDRLEKYVRGKESVAERKSTALNSFTGKLYHDSLGAISAYAVGAYYGRTGGFRAGPIDAGLLLGGLGLAWGLFGDSTYASHAGTVGKSTVFVYLGLMGFNQGRKWASEADKDKAGTPSSARGVHDSVRGREGRTLDPQTMQAVASRLA